MPAIETGYTEIGAFDAKTKLSEILRRVEQGERFTITLRGRAVADVVPSQRRDQRAIDEAVERLINFPRVKGVSGDTVLEWIREGRK
ncbi:MAG: type II toxin-antitoxin system prevent-host-death family antitoxin [Terracidiphilus sp.]